MLNIYQLHSNPDQLKGYDQAHEKIPHFVWEQLWERSQPPQIEEIKKRKNILAKDPNTAYKYAYTILAGRFPEGEDTISQNPNTAYLYAKRVLGKPFPKGEEAIAQDAYFAFRYAENVLQDRFPRGEDIMKQAPNIWENYKRMFRIDD